MRIDVHTHILPTDWPDMVERYGDPRWPRLQHLDSCSAHLMVEDEVFREVTSQLYAVERRLEDMSVSGVDQQVLSTVPVMFSYWAKPERTRELARYLNEHLAGVVREHPRAFSALGTVPLNDPQMAIEELERCMGELGMVGVEIGTNVSGEDLDGPRFLPFFQRAAELEALLLIHPWQVVGQGRLSQYYFTYTVAMPSETAFAVGALLFGGVLARVPDLRVVFAHGGGSIPFIIGRVERGWEAWEPAREKLSVPPISQLGSCFFDSLVWDVESLELLTRRVGAEQILLGSDYPFIMGEERPGAMVEQTAFSAAEQSLILGGNAMRLLPTGATSQ